MAREILTDYDFKNVSRVVNLPPAVEDADPVILSQLKDYTGGPVIESQQVISEDYSIGVGKNGISLGPVSVSEGVSVTIPAGSVWRILT
jgi:hypothetical protein